MRENRGRNNCRYLMFNDDETRGRFILLYKDLFVPYSEKSMGPIMAKQKGHKEVLKQLLDGYCIDGRYMWSSLVECGGYPLTINIKPDDWRYISEKLNMEKVKFANNRYYWRLA